MNKTWNIENIKSDNPAARTRALENALGVRLSIQDMKDIRADMKLSTEDFIESTLNFIETVETI